MNYLFAKMFSARNPKFDLAIIALAFVGFVMACGGSDTPSAPKKPIPAAYLGSWTGQDGTTINIRGDGTGDYNAGGSKVSGAAVEVDEAAKEIKFTMLGIDTGKYKIDSPPSGNTMKLNGTTYKRSGGFDTTSSDSKTTSAAAPSDAEAQALVKQTMMDFGASVKAGDFTSFHETLSTALQKEATPEQLATAFKDFIDKKMDTSLVKDMKATFTAPPSVSGQMLNASGSYPTKPPTTFDLKYLNEGGEWKLASINVKIK